jgi:predicted Fe-Mo cluster-binding NifX family protein
MNICIPVDDDRGLESPVCAHFGSAPAFMVVDTESQSCRAIPNRNQRHDHGQCTPLAWLQQERIDGAVVGGIGRGALQKLNAANVPVFLSEHATVAEALAAWKAGTLKLVQPAMACAHHGHAHR